MIKPASVFLSCILFASCTNTREKSSDQTEKKSDTAVVHTPPANPYAPIDISPMDMSYFPVNYSQQRMTHDMATPPVMRVIYSRPHRQLVVFLVIFLNMVNAGDWAPTKRAK